MNKEGIARWLSSYLSQTLSIELDQVSTSTRFDEYGLDSLQAIGLIAALARWLGQEVGYDLFYDHPSIDDLSEHIACEHQRLMK